MVKTSIKLLILCRSNKEYTENKGKTWSRGTNSRLPFGVKVNLKLCNQKEPAQVSVGQESSVFQMLSLSAFNLRKTMSTNY